MKHWIAFFITLLVTVAMAADNDRTVKPIQFPKGKSIVTVSGSIMGYNHIDYQLRAGAGQTMKINLKGSNRAKYFNLLPPGSTDVAMAIGELSGNRFEGVLPDEGSYTIRVHLIRAAARRDESSGFELSVEIEGRPLQALHPNEDALVPGTRYHAQSQVSCELAYTKTRTCEVGVIRRGHDGTATVELKWDKTGIRRILFVKGKPVTADTSSPMAYTREERGWKVTFSGDERYEIPEPLVFGG
jgi:hypothetical protein